jgi:ArsR family transcriptional regulator
MNIDPKELFSALAHDTRLRCMMLFMQHQELCVCELTYAIGTAQPHVSRHLAQLRELGLVSDRREGLWIHYRIHAQLPEWVIAVCSPSDGRRDEKPNCDKAAAEVCPARPRQPMTTDWGVSDPADEKGGEVARMTAFRTAFRELQNHISIWFRRRRPCSGLLESRAPLSYPPLSDRSS